MAKAPEGYIHTKDDGSRFIKLQGDWVKLPEKMQGAKQEDGFSFSEMASNIIPSAKALIGDLYTALTNPVETYSGVKSTVEGALQSGSTIFASDMFDKGRELLPKNIGAFSPIFGAFLSGEDKRPYSDALVNGVKERYGTIENFKETLEKDPVGALADFSAIASAGAGVSRKAAQYAATTNPINIAAKTGKAAARVATPKSLPARMYERAMKPTTTLPQPQRRALVDTALKHQINLTHKGAAKLQKLIDDFDAQISGLIAKGEASGKTIPKKELFRHVSELKAKMGGVKVDAPADIKKINKIVSDFDDHLAKMGKSNLTAKELQELKRGAYARVTYQAKKGKGSQAAEDTRKAIARAAKEGVEEIVPEVGPVNRAMGDLLELQPHLERAVSRIENRNLLGLQPPAATAAGTYIGNAIGGPAGAATGAAIGGTVGALSHPKIAGANAIRLQKMLDKPTIDALLKSNPNISAAELSAILAGRAIENNQWPQQ